MDPQGRASGLLTYTTRFSSPPSVMCLVPPPPRARAHTCPHPPQELEFQTSPQTAIEALIHINNQLRQPEAAVGVLTYAQKHLHMELKESWCVRGWPEGGWGGYWACMRGQRGRAVGVHLVAILIACGRVRICAPALAGKCAPPSPPLHPSSRYEKLCRWDEALDAYERRLQREVPGGNEYHTVRAAAGGCWGLGLRVLPRSATRCVHMRGGDPGAGRQAGREGHQGLAWSGLPGLLATPDAVQGGHSPPVP